MFFCNLLGMIFNLNSNAFMYKLLLLFCFIAASNLYAQIENATWYFGKFGGIKFTAGNPFPITGKIDTWEGCSVYSDPITGDPLLYTDGKKLWNSSNTVVPGGDTLKSGISSTQCAIFVPDPGNPKRVYLFTTPDLTFIPPSDPRGFFSYISLETPSPSMLSANTMLAADFSEKITAVKDCAGSAYWVLYHHRYLPKIYAYKVTSTGVATTPVISTYSSVYAAFTVGGMKISPDRSKLAVVTESNANNYIASITVFDFNSISGAVSNARSIAGTSSYGNYGLSFSSDSKKLYTSGAIDRFPTSEGALFQFDLDAGNETAIANSVFIKKFGSSRIFGMQLGPDGKIYVSADKPTQLDVIEKPNSKGDSISYKRNVLNQSFKCVLGLPNVIEYQTVKNTDTAYVCLNSSVKIGTESLPGFTYLWSPNTGLNNPTIANPIATPTIPTLYTLQVFNAQGCVSAQSIYVGIYPSFYFFADEPLPMCKGGKTQLNARGATTYKWTPSYGLSKTDIPNPMANPDSSIQYTLIASNGQCTDSTKVLVKVMPFPIVSAGPDKTTCPGGTVEIGNNTQAGIKYAWSPITGVSSPFSSKTNITATDPSTRYILSGENEIGCISYDTVYVTTVNDIKAVVSKDTSICLGSVAKLTAFGGSTYRWYPSTGLSDSTSANPLASPSISTTYKVIVKNGLCVDSSNVRVNIIQAAVADAGADKATCPGEPLKLGVQAINGATYSWKPTTFLDDPNSATPICSPANSITYYLTVTNPTKCVSYDTVEVTLASKLTVQHTPDTQVCAGSSVQLFAKGGSTYSWLPTTGLSDPTIANPIANPSSTIIYTVEARNGSCVGTDSLTIQVIPLPNVNAGKDTSVCIGNSITLNVSGANAYNWTPNIGLNNTLSNSPLCTPTSTTMYYVTGSNGACSVTDSILVTVYPIPSIKVSGDTLICKNGIAQLNAQGADQYQWQQSPDLSSQQGSTVLAKPSQNTMYYVQGIKNGCISSLDSIYVKIRLDIDIMDKSDTSICAGQTALLKVKNGSSFIVSPNINTVYKSNDSIIIAPLSTTTYYISGINNGCTYTDSATVIVVPQPIIKASEDTIICIGTDATLKVNGGVSYIWSPAGLLDNPTSDTPIAKGITKNTVFYVTGSNSLCSSIDSVFVQVSQPVNATFSLFQDGSYKPGDISAVTLTIPPGISSVQLGIQYDECCSSLGMLKDIKPASLQINTKNNLGNIVYDIKSADLQGGSFIIPVTMYLPQDARNSNAYTLAIQTIDAACINATVSGIEIPYQKQCAWNIRGVNQSKSQFSVSVQDDNVLVQSGLTGSMNARIYSIAGQTVWSAQHYMIQGIEEKIGLPELPNGMYFLELYSGPWKSMYSLSIVK